MSSQLSSTSSYYATSSDAEIAWPSNIVEAVKSNSVKCHTPSSRKKHSESRQLRRETSDSESSQSGSQSDSQSDSPISSRADSLAGSQLDFELDSQRYSSIKSQTRSETRSEISSKIHSLVSLDINTQIRSKAQDVHRPPRGPTKGLHELPPKEGPESDVPRDYVTGRMLSEHGRACMRCFEKDLICTLTFVGKENEPQCAACKRSKTPYCVRFKPRGDTGKAVPWTGPVWMNPNFVAGTADRKTPAMPAEELQRIVREFMDGTPGYVMGDYISDSDKSNFALPSVRHDGLVNAIYENADKYSKVGWKAVLPLGERRVMTNDHVQVHRQTEEWRTIVPVTPSVVGSPRKMLDMMGETW